MSSRRLLALCLFACGCAATPGTQHSAEPGSEDEERVSQLGRENANLRRRIALLEDRVSVIEGLGPRSSSEPTASAKSSGRGAPLPVVKLAPDEVGGERASRSPQSLADVPYSSPYQSMQQPVPEPAPAPRDGAWAVEGSQPAAGSGSGPASKGKYRLVGNRLVTLTKKAKVKPDRPSQSRKGKSIIAEYDHARAIYKAGEFSKAFEAFTTFAKKHPNHPYADNALYWKGESAYDQAHYSDALASFTAVIERYGGGNKASDALLKIGLCYAKLNDHDNAVDVMTQLIDAYPRSNAATIARRRLREAPQSSAKQTGDTQ